MIEPITDLAHWPRTRFGDPIFSSTEDAIFYAHLIINNESYRLKIARLREKVLSDLKVIRSIDPTNLQLMFDLAVKSQFYRECLEEAERIEKEA